MSLTKYATLDSAEVLDVKGSPVQSRTANLSTIAHFDDYRTEDGYLYVRIRAISSRCNRNNDGWPSVELAGSPEVFERHHSAGGFTVESAEGNPEFGFSTFVGKPVFVDHHNSNPKKARGVIVDAKLNVLDQKLASGDDYWTSSDVDREHLPPTEVELLLEVDAKTFPRLAQAIVSGELDGFSMGCFVAGTPITLDDGTQKDIEKIQVGDEVLTRSGEIESVTATMTRQYSGDVHHIETYGQAQTMTLTSEHPVWVTHDKQGGCAWVKASNLKKGDYVLTPSMKHDTDDYQESTYARLIGFYLAEGNLGYDKKRYPDGRPVFVEWNFNADELDYLNVVKRDLGALGYTACGPYVKNNCATVRCNSPKLAAYFLRIAGRHSWGKKLIPEILGWQESTQRLLLESYFQGDGHMRSGTKVEVGTASRDLAHQIYAMANRCGYRMTPPTKQHSPSASKKRPKYSMFIELEPNEYEGAQWRGFQNKAGTWRKVTKVTSEHFEGPVYNFDVDGDDSYVAADIAVHNCDVERSKCSHCGHVATSPEEYCSHIVMKGADHDYKTADGNRVSKRSYENCYGIKFFEISAVFDPADETALAREVRAAVNKEADIVPGPPPGYEGALPDPVRPNQAQEVESLAMHFEMQGIDPESAMQMAQEKVNLQQGQLPGHGEGEIWQPKAWEKPGYPQGMPPPIRPGNEGVPAGFADSAEEALNERYPQRPIMNNPYMSSIRTAENPLPQEMMTRAPEEIDTLRDQKVCPVCGNEEMTGETCDVCGFVEEPEGFDNPDLNWATEVREKMKQTEEQDPLQEQQPGQPQPGQPGEQIGEPQQQSGPLTSQMPKKAPQTAGVKSEMRWTPKVHPKTAGRINQIERPISPSNPPQSDEPRVETVIKDQTRPVTAAMATARQLMTNAQLKRDNMNTRTADGPTPPGDTSAELRTDVTGVGGVMDASNDAASKANAQIDVTGIGSTGVTDVSADKSESIPTASKDGDDSGFNTDKTTDDSGPTSTFGDSDGSHKGVGDPVTSEPFPASEDGVKKSQRVAYEDGTLEGLEQQGDPIAQGGSAVQGVQPIDSVATPSYKRVNVLEHTTSPSNNSGPTDTWSGTDGNGVTKQMDPVSTDSMEWGGVKTPDVQLHTGRVSIAALRLAEMEVELGLIERDAKWRRMADLDHEEPAVLHAQLKTLSKVKTAGLNKLAARRQSGATRVPSFQRIATGAEHTEQAPVSDVDLDSGLFLK